MKKVIVTADSTCDLTKEQREKYGILISPLYVRTGEEEHKDGVDIDSAALFAYVEKTGTLPKTAACSAEDYTNLFKPFIDEGCEVIHISLSSEFSSCCQNAHIAASELEGVYVVDSLNLSTGSGLLAIEAAELAREGKSASEIFDILEKKKQHLNVSFVLDTMEYLAKGGRCSSMVSLAAGLLKIRLCIEVCSGKMVISKKYRGKLAPVLKQYVHERLQAADPDLKRIFITDSGVDEAVKEELRQAILEEAPFAEILRSTAGCTISSHCGPACLGILFFENN